MLIANNNVAPLVPGQIVDFNLLTQGDTGPFSWHHGVSAYIAQNYTRQTRVVPEGEYLKEVSITFTPRGVVPPFPGVLGNATYYGGGVAEAAWTIGPFPPGAIVSVTAGGGRGRSSHDLDIFGLGTNYITEDDSLASTRTIGGNTFYGLPYVDDDFAPGNFLPEFSLELRVKNNRLGATARRIVGPMYGNFVTPENPSLPWSGAYQVYTSDLRCGPGIDGLPDGFDTPSTSIYVGEGKNFNAPTSPHKGVLLCEVLDEVMNDQVKVWWGRSEGYRLGERLIWWVDLADPANPRYVQPRYVRGPYGPTIYKGIFDAAQRPALVIGAGGYGKTPGYELPDRTGEYWKLHDFYTRMPGSAVIAGYRRVFFNYPSRSQRLRISMGEPYFSWRTR